MSRHVAVIDIGKTNAKLAVVEMDTLTELDVVTRPNVVRPGPPYPHFDLDGMWAFFLDGLTDMQARYGIDAISVTTHGAAAVLLDEDGALAVPMLDYEHDGPVETAAAYEAIRPPFAETGSPRLPLGLNLGAQLHWLLDMQPGLRARLAHVVTYPQFWGYRLTGNFASDVTSLGCHTDLWEPFTGQPSSLVAALGLSEKLAPAHRSSDVLGTITAEVAARTGMAPGTPVHCGIHDSNASLLPHLKGREGPFAVVSTGTWVIAMAIGGATPALDAARDTLVNVNAFGAPVPSARFMGGREYEIVRGGSDAVPSEADRRAVLDGPIMLLPSVVEGCGPFPDAAHRWTKSPATQGERIFALSLYLALMTQTCLDLVGAAGPVIVEGPFARNADFLAMLGACRGTQIEVAQSATGTSIGAALLTDESAGGSSTVPAATGETGALRAYAAAWTAALPA